MALALLLAWLDSIDRSSVHSIQTNGIELRNKPIKNCISVKVFTVPICSLVLLNTVLIGLANHPSKNKH